MSPAELRPYLAFVFLGILLWALRRAAGRLAPRAALAPIVFLVTRRAVLVCWVLGAAGMFALLLNGAAARGREPDLFFVTGLSVFCGLGFAALVVGPVWAAVRAFAAAPTFELEPGETLLREFDANHFVGGEARGGKLLVTTRRLGFRPHRFNVQLSRWSARLEDIRGFRFEGERFLLVETNEKTSPEWVVAPRPSSIAEYVQQIAKKPERERAAAGADSALDPRTPA
jgi:hypothetical protein